MRTEADVALLLTKKEDVGPTTEVEHTADVVTQVAGPTAGSHRAVNLRLCPCFVRQAQRAHEREQRTRPTQLGGMQ